MISQRTSLRTAVIGTLGIASLALAGTAIAAPAATPAAHQAAVQQAAKATITAKPSVTAVRAWQEFKVTGTTTGIKAGEKVTLQQKQSGKWVSLPAATPVNKTGGYALRVKLGLKGKNDLRIVHGTTASPVFNVTVR
ncbi:hypothetical protein ACVNF4_26870 [Streptomyces sp. S6]